jgi:glycosyltransferase involved in cell wall biosynthesis
MATWNGSKYVAMQLASILPQIAEQDEIVVVDDKSADDTVGIIRRLEDPRIRIIQHTENLGVVRSFEDAVRAARGELIFLSDQDDLWVAEKVESFLHAFNADPRVTIVASAVQRIDEGGAPLQISRQQTQPRFRAGFLANMVRNHYQGSAMAFRSSIRSWILPFPAGHEDCQLLHDLWIGVVNAWHGGKVAYLETPLLLYRRHGANLSGTMSFRRQAEKRIRLLSALYRAWRKTEHAVD